jgi:hypothetical protein
MSTQTDIDVSQSSTPFGIKVDTSRQIIWWNTLQPLKQDIKLTPIEIRYRRSPVPKKTTEKGVYALDALDDWSHWELATSIGESTFRATGDQTSRDNVELWFYDMMSSFIIWFWQNAILRISYLYIKFLPSLFLFLSYYIISYIDAIPSDFS